MKNVVCVNKGKIKSLTIGKTYTFTKVHSGRHHSPKGPLSGKEFKGIWVINDSQIEKYYSAKRFVPIDEWRDIQLSRLISE